MNLRKALVSCFIALSPYSITLGQQPIEIDKGESFYAGKKSSYFIDSTGTTGSHNILEKTFVLCRREILNLGNTKYTIWVKFSVTNKSGDEIYLHIQNPLLKNIEVYTHTPTEKPLRLLFKGSFMQNFNSRPIYNENWIIPVKADTSVMTFYIKGNSDFPFQIPVEVSSKEKLIKNNLLQELFWGLYTGIMIFAFVYNLFIYFSVRERRYLYYILYVLTSMLFYLSLQGFTFMFLWPNHPMMNKYMCAMICVTNIFLTLFTTNFLKITKKQKTVFYFGRTLMVLFILVALISFMDDYGFSNQLSQLLSIVACMYYIYAGFSSLRRKIHDAGYFVVAWTLFLLFVIIFILTVNDVIISNFFTTHCIFIGHITEVLLLSFALANRINSLKKENEKFQKELLKAHIEVQEQTFHNISEEIHDNFGQALILVKLNITTIDLSDSDTARDRLNDTETIITKIIRDMRDLAKSLNADFINNIGLGNAISEQLNLLQKTGFATKFETFGDIYKLHSQRELFIYRIIQELINNIVKHAKASLITIQIYYQMENLLINVQDNGRGFETGQAQSQSNKGLGLHNINNRVNLLKGSIKIDSDFKTGTKVILSFPKL